MKTKLSRIIMVCIMFALVITSTSCKKGNVNGNLSNAADSSSSLTSSSVVEEVVEVRDLGGYDFVIGSHWGEGYFPEPGKSQAGDKMLARFDEIQQKYNCKITYRAAPIEQFNTEVTTAFAAGQKYCDILETNLWYFRNFYDAGYMEPLNDIKSLRLSNSKWAQTYKNVTTIDDKVYGVNFTSWYNRMPHFFYTTFFNKKLLEKYQLESPYTLFENGNWTWDKFREMAKTLTKDTNGDGKNDTWGITSIDRMFEYSAIRSNGAREIEKTETGAFVLGFANDKAYKGIEFARDVINVDKSFLNLHDPRTANTDWGLPMEEFKKGNVGFFVYHTEAFVWDNWLTQMPDDFGMLPFPTGPDAKSKYNAAITGDTRVFTIPKTCPDKETTGYIFDRITEPLDGTKADSWEGYAQRTYFRDAESFKYYKQMFETADYDYGAEMGPGTVLELTAAILSVTRDSAATPAEAIMSVRPKIQASLEETLNKIK